MKRSRLLSALLALTLVLSLLSGCSLLLRDRQDYVDMVPFDEIEYTRPDLDDMLETADNVIATLKATKPSASAVKAELNSLFADFQTLRTLQALTTIRSDSDVTDDYYRGEMDFCSDAVIAFQAKLDEVFAACAASAIRDSLDDFFGEGFLDDYGEDYTVPEALYALQRQENELINRYFSAMASRTLTLNGTDYTVDDLYLADKAGTLPEGVTLQQAITEYYIRSNAELGDIFIQLVRVRHAIAAEAGYDSYLELAYDQNYRDYTPAEAAAFTDAVKTCLVPLFREAGESGLLDDAYYGTPELDPDDALMTVMSIADSMGGDMKDTADFLLEYDLVNAEVSEKKVSDSYELYLPDYEAPYILAGTVGYAEDILTIAHEFGHAVDDFVHYEAQDSTDVSETLSQAMEYLTLFYLQDDAVYDSVLAYKLADVLRMYAEQGSYNAFEERIYAMRDEDLTLENVNAMALACAREFGLESEWGDAYDSTSWVDISHFFQQPMYIISYIASDSLAIQFYEQELAQQGRGLELYEDAMELAGDTEFMDLASELGLRDPLSAQQVQSIAKLMRDQLL